MTVVEEVLFRRCPGYKDIPAHLVHVDGFTPSKGVCKKCQKVNDDTNNPMKNAIISLTEKYIPQRIRRKHPLRKEMHSYAKETFLGNRGESELKEFIKGIMLDTQPAKEVLKFLFPETKESMVTQRTVNHKTRNKPLYTMLKELYNYTCQVEGCNETEVEVAHIYKHSLPDSVDNETNTWCLCRNHHRAYDANRMIFNPALNGRFIRYDVFGKVYEIGRIIYDDKHTIDIKWIKKSREWHDRKK